MRHIPYAVVKNFDPKRAHDYIFIVRLRKLHPNPPASGGENVNLLPHKKMFRRRIFRFLSAEMLFSLSAHRLVCWGLGGKGYSTKHASTRRAREKHKQLRETHVEEGTQNIHMRISFGRY